MRSLAASFLALSALLGSSGCATIVKGRYQDLTINSSPPGAAFEVDGISGTTPATVPVERKLRQHTVVISKPGYETAQVRVGRDINLWTAGNVIWGFFGMPIGIGVDLINGSAYRLAKDNVQADLHPEFPMADRHPPGGPQGASNVRTAEHVEPQAEMPDRPGGQ